MFIFAADLHFKTKPFKHGPEVDDTFKGFEYLCLLSRKYGSIPIVLGGDIFDNNRIHPEVLSTFQNVRMNYEDIPLYYINGNHDVAEPSWMEFITNTSRLGPVKTTLPDGTRLAGMSWMINSRIPDHLNTIDKDIDFLVVHQFIEPTFCETDEFNSIVTSSIPSSTFKDFPAVLAGDIHKSQIYPNSIPPLAYPSSTSIQQLNEVPGCFLITDNPEDGFVPFGNKYIKPVRLPGRDVIHVYISEDIANDLDEIYQRIERELQEYEPNPVTDELEGVSAPREPWLALHISGINTQALQLITERFKDQCFILPRVRVTHDEEELSEDVNVTMTGQSTLDVILQCLSAEDLNGVLKQMAAELITNEDEFLENSAVALGVKK